MSQTVDLFGNIHRTNQYEIEYKHYLTKNQWEDLKMSFESGKLGVSLGCTLENPDASIILSPVYVSIDGSDVSNVVKLIHPNNKVVKI